MKQAVYKYLPLIILFFFLPIAGAAPSAASRTDSAPTPAMTLVGLKKHVTQLNEQCPIHVGGSMDIVSYDIDCLFFTIRCRYNIPGRGLKGVDKAKAMMMMKAIGKQGIQDLYDLNIGIKMECTDDTGEVRTVTIDRHDMLEILQDTNTSPEAAIDIYIENSRKGLPLSLGPGLTFTDVLYTDDCLINEVTVDEFVISIDALEANKEMMKSAIANHIAGSQDVAFGLILDWLVQAGKGFGYCYVGNKTGKKVTLTFPPAELQRLIVND